VRCAFFSVRSAVENEEILAYARITA